MTRSFPVFDDLRMAALRVFSPEKTALLLAAPVHPDLRTHEIQFLKDLVCGNRNALQEQIQALNDYADGQPWRVAVDPSHFTPH